MSNFSDNANSGCFGNFVRRISCFRSLPTHPADHILDSKTVKSDDRKGNPKAEAKTQVAASPGIVARLMGLESLPENNWVARKGVPDSLVRSRSVNFADCMLEFDLTQARHRRVRTSASFREVPTLSQQHGNDFLVVYFNDADETEGVKPKVRKSEMGFGERKQRKEQRSKNKENTKEKVLVKTKENERNNKISELRYEPSRGPSLSSKVGASDDGGAKRSGLVQTRKKNACRNDLAGSKTESPLKPINQKKPVVESKFTRKRKVQNSAAKVKPKCDSQNSSPLSVLEANQCPKPQERTVSGPSRSMGLNSNRKSSRTASYTDDLREGAIKNKDRQSIDISETQYYNEVVGNLYRLTENDIKESNWTARNFLGFEGLEEVCMEFEKQMLDLLLNQVVVEFAEIQETSQ